MPRVARPPEPGQDAIGERGLVPAVAGEDDVDVGRLVVEEVAAR